ncbi:MAG: hypothetical protein AAFO29_00970 [Actinomycetota bacterium]
MAERGDGGRLRRVGIGAVIGLVVLIGCTRTPEAPTAIDDGSDPSSTAEPSATGSSTTGAADAAAGSSTTGDEPTTSGSDPTSDPAPDDADVGSAKVVRFVYFVEAGEPMRDEVRQAIERQAVELQRYWYQQFGGTFQLDDPVVTVVDGDNDAAWYDVTPDGIHADPRWYRLGNISTEVRSKLGTVDARFVTYPATTVAEPRVGVNFGGAWMDGDDALCILGETPSFPYPDGNDAHCLGHVAHELGHVYGLPHVGPPEDCMQFGFYDAEIMCRFSAANREAVRNDPTNVGWLDVDLGIELDPDPVPSTDADDDQAGNDQATPDPGVVEVAFVNDGCQTVEVFWLNFQGELVPYGVIAPSSDLGQQTFVDHEWVFQVDGGEIDRFVVAGPGDHRIDSGGCDG